MHCTVTPLQSALLCPAMFDGSKCHATLHDYDGKWLDFCLPIGGAVLAGIVSTTERQQMQHSLLHQPVLLKLHLQQSG